MFIACQIFSLTYIDNRRIIVCWFSGSHWDLKSQDQMLIWFSCLLRDFDSDTLIGLAQLNHYETSTGLKWDFPLSIQHNTKSGTVPLNEVNRAQFSWERERHTTGALCVRITPGKRIRCLIIPDCLLFQFVLHDNNENLWVKLCKIYIHKYIYYENLYREISTGYRTVSTLILSQM